VRTQRGVELAQHIFLAVLGCIESRVKIRRFDLLWIPKQLEHTVELSLQAKEQNERECQ
jgi:hypothetical protein